MSGRPRCSILMRCKNSEWVIGQALSSLFSQSFDDFELIVIDSGSTDGTLELVADHPHRLLSVEPADYFPGRVLNAAAREARGELLVLWNSDAVALSRDTLTELVASFDDERVQAAFGRQVPRPEAEPWVRRDYAASFPRVGPAPEWMGLSFPLAAIRREAWEAHPFYTAAWGSEDTEWAMRARRRGEKIAYVPEALVMHSHNYTLREGHARRFIEGEADAFIYASPKRVSRVLASALASGARDSVEALRSGRPDRAPRAVTQRLFDAWGYLRGQRHGWQRRRENDDDSRRGQLEALRHHRSVRTRADRAALSSGSRR